MGHVGMNPPIIFSVFLGLLLVGHVYMDLFPVFSFFLGLHPLGPVGMDPTLFFPVFVSGEFRGGLVSKDPRILLCLLGVTSNWVSIFRVFFFRFLFLNCSDAQFRVA